MKSARPIGELEGTVVALWSDLDGTLTTGGRIEAATLTALEALAAAGIPFFVVTGRSAGWGQAILATMPVAAVVAENGGVWFRRGADGQLIERLALPAAELAEWRRRMSEAVAAVAGQWPAARLSSDSVYRRVDLAIDWNEEVHLDPADADRIVDLLRGHGLAASRSSVHVNFAPPGFDKLSGCRALIVEALGRDPDDLAPHLYVGDALNDAPMFAAFPRSVGVANIATSWDALLHRPGYLTPSAEGAGLREVIARVLDLRA